MSEDDHVKAFVKLEQYLCHKLSVDVPKLDVLIMDWAAKDKSTWEQWEALVRGGQRLAELRLFAKSLDKADPIPAPPTSGGIFDL